MMATPLKTEAAAALFAALLAAVPLVASGAAHADKVGVAAAVKPDAFSQLNGGAKSQISLGKNIFYNERINTSTGGLVQVLLLDGSTFTVGPGSDLVIDKFVYNPATQEGEVVASFSKGVLRYVGGKISKQQDAVSVKTPEGALAIRGGMFQGYIDGGKSVFSFLYGMQMVFTSNAGETLRIYQSGYTLAFNAAGAPFIRPTTPADTQLFMQGLRGYGRAYAGGTGDHTGKDAKNEPAGGATGRQPWFNVSSDFITIETLISDFTTTQINQEVAHDEQGGGGEPQNGGEFHGYASGIEISQDVFCLDNNGYEGGESLQTESYGEGPNEGGFQQVRIVSSATPGDVTVTLDPGSDTVSAGLTVYGGPTFDNALTKSVFVFGGSNPADSDYISDRRFFAKGQLAGSAITNYPWNPFHGPYNQPIDSLEGGLASAGYGNGVTVGEQPLTQLCSNCDFIKWGAWGTTVTTNEGSTVTKTDGWWVVGDIRDAVQLPFEGSAKYQGFVVGNVVNDGNAYTASGDMTMNWNFASRNGDLTISNFDGRTFGTSAHGLTQIPNANQFSGALAGSGVFGAANGSFVANGADPAGGVIGNWGVSGYNYTATGIFGGGKVPGDIAGQ